MRQNQLIKKYLINVGLTFGAVFVGFSIFEVGLRIAGISYPLFYVYDPDRGVALRPGVSGWWKQEGQAYIKINSDGLRDYEHSKEKPQKTFRIAVLGDSYAEAFQVPIEKAFWSVMEKELRGCRILAGLKPEAINFGVSGYGTAQELLTLRHKAWQYSPDVIVLAFLTGNDIRNNSRVLNQASYVPYFIYRGEELVLDESFRNVSGFLHRESFLGKIFRSIINYSRVFQAINQARNNLIIAKMQQKKPKYWNVEGHEIALDDKIYQRPSEPVWQEAWNITEELIVQMKNEIVANKKDFLVVTLSNGIQVHPNRLVRDKFMKNMGIKNLFYPDLRIKDLGDREGFPVLNLAQPFQVYAEKHLVCLHGFDNAEPCSGHWNAQGHRLAGKMIAAKLCNSLKTNSYKKSK